MTKISITRALNELKLLDKRIDKTINSSKFLDYTINGKQKTKDFSPKEELQSSNDLMAQRAKIKTAIMKSNAETDVVINDKTIKVIDAIEMKDSIQYKKTLLNKLVQDRNSVRSAIENHNAEVQYRLDGLLQANFGKESKTKDSETEAISKPFLERNEAKETDLIEIDKTISKLEEEIMTFESEVDFVLSESNSTTFIEV